jgi:hypothetical protein
MANTGDGAGNIGAVAKSFDQYEYVGVIIPGATLLLGLLLLWSEPFRTALGKDFSVGSLVLFLVAAFVAGHVVRAIAEVFEGWLWSLFGGMPTDWEPDNKRRLLDVHQHPRFEAQLSRLLNKKGVRLTDFKGNRADWRAVVREIYAAVARADSARVDAFNRTYGMLMGVTMALVIIGIVLAVKLSCNVGPPLAMGQGYLWPIEILLLVIIVLLVHRTYAFGNSYGRELFVQFLRLPLK